MSNVIKASQIAYAENVRHLDMNDRSEEYRQKFIEDFISSNIALKQIDFDEVSRKLETEKVLTTEDVDFTPGIAGEQVYVEDEAPVDTTAATLESRLSEKRMELESLNSRIEEINAEAERILEDARTQVTAMMEEARTEAEQEKEAIFAQAREEGYNEGVAKAAEENLRKEEQLRQEEEELRRDYEKQVEELEPAFVEVMIKYIRKLTGIYADDKREIILHLIDEAFKGKHNNENFIIRVSEADFPMASYSKDSIRGYLSDNSSVEVVMDKLLEKNQCMIETESRIFDCSLDSGMNSLIEDIRLLAEKE